LFPSYVLNFFSFKTCELKLTVTFRIARRWRTALAGKPARMGKPDFESTGGNAEPNQLAITPDGDHG
jgi:hypothetical protein